MAIAALEPLGLIFRQAAGVTMAAQMPKLAADRRALMEDVRTLLLEALVRMKLTSNCDRDRRVHIRDMVSIGMIDEVGLSGSRRSYELGSRTARRPQRIKFGLLT